MASSPPASPPNAQQRPTSMMMRSSRSNSRMSIASKSGGASRASDDDGKTAVKVAVRVRPPLRSTDPGFELIPQRFQRSMVQVNTPTSLAIDSPQGRKLFVFDRVFSEDVGQDGVWSYLSESVNAFVQGYNVSMLAYGQSGAGKSYTMGTSGPEEQSDPDFMGVIPRAAAALFEKLEGSGPKNNRVSVSGLRTPTRYSLQVAAVSKACEEKNWTLKATYMEIYNEQLRDLLVPDHIPQSERGQVSIREDAKGHILLMGLHQVDINSVEDLMNALNFGSAIRQTDSTAINAKSSRSHAVFSLNLVQRKSKTATTPTSEKRFSVPLEAMTGNEGWITIDSKLHFVDLAGSERLKNTGAQGERAREGISINAGLASLGKVISQLSARQAGSHVSYRDSKLTRLLQDSLGGNAITYMIACVTQAEFHLSETLNTVQYAQRARAIQSKPQIQQVSDESDKQALIERLKAEIAFLRDQVRMSERSGDRRGTVVSERHDRQSEREIELQNELLDSQENYTALTQRHAKLIAQMSKAREGEVAETRVLQKSLGDDATERLKRSNSFAEAVEQVVLEYETTIRSLEQSLSSTRSCLSNSESTLLEKETKCAFVESQNQQLQTRVQKMMDREASTENYLQELESKLDGHTFGEEQNSAIVTELRKEISRIRENESSCEDYISTLEERLAEADQDSELMQREIERLEHVVDRQRSLGKLDNLLLELDHFQQHSEAGGSTATAQLSDGTKDIPAQARKVSSGSNRSVVEAIPEVEEGTAITSQSSDIEINGPIDNGESIEEEESSIVESPVLKAGCPAQSPVQNAFVADKLENVAQELLGLRAEHEATVTEYGTLSAKYDEAMRTLRELQDALDEARHPVRDSTLSGSTSNQTRPTSFLADARVNEAKNYGQFSPSQSLSSELSSAGECSSVIETSDAEAAIKKQAATGVSGIQRNEALTVEVENLRRLAAEREAAQKELTAKYNQLHEQHVDTLDTVEELKTAVSKSRMNINGVAPRSASPVIRRKSSQNIMTIDRAHRSFASLRNIAAENFENDPDVMQNFELNLNSAMHELYSRSERVQELEAELTTVKKEMETKMAIISGLTRERSSMKNSSPMDISVVSTMRDQLLQSANQIRMLQETHSMRERQLCAEVDDLRAIIDSHAKVSRIDEHLSTSQADNSQTIDRDEKIASLETQLATWEDRHRSVLQSMQASEQQFMETITDLSGQLQTMQTSKDVQFTTNQSREQTITNEMADDRADHLETVKSMQQELEIHKETVKNNAAKIAELEEAQSSARAQLKDAIKTGDLVSQDLQSHKDVISKLRQETADHEMIIKSHEDGMRLLQDSHAEEMEQYNVVSAIEREAAITELNIHHEAKISSLEAELNISSERLTGIAQRVSVALGVDVSIEKTPGMVADLLADHLALASEREQSRLHEDAISSLTSKNDEAMKELEVVRTELAGLLSSSSPGVRSSQGHTTLAEQLSALKIQMTDLETQNKKSSRLIEELEDQLAANFDQHQAANNRLSTLQSERNKALEDANANHAKVLDELEAIKEEYADLQAKLTDDDSSPTKRSNSMLRKSASVVSLPSPPPAIPLPPLPINAAGMTTNNVAGIPVPPPTSIGRPPSSALNNVNNAAQIAEDQAARIRSIERHLSAEKQLTSTLEEALTDLERQSNKVKADGDAWRKRAAELEAEMREMREEREREKKELNRVNTNGTNGQDARWSLQVVEEERRKRRDAEIARQHLEERMNAINKKKKKGSLNCF